MCKLKMRAVLFHLRVEKMTWMICFCQKPGTSLNSLGGRLIILFSLRALWLSRNLLEISYHLIKECDQVQLVQKIFQSLSKCFKVKFLSCTSQSKNSNECFQSLTSFQECTKRIPRTKWLRIQPSDSLRWAPSRLSATWIPQLLQRRNAVMVWTWPRLFSWLL